MEFLKSIFQWYFYARIPKKFLRAVAIDFDGVVAKTNFDNGYVTVEGESNLDALDFIINATKLNYLVYIHSTRCINFRSRKALKLWLEKEIKDYLVYSHYDTTPHKIFQKLCYMAKPYALFYIDDKAFHSNGTKFPELQPEDKKND